MAPVTMPAMSTMADKIHEKVSDMDIAIPVAATVPERFRDVNHQAEHASFSRVSCCFVNEGLAEANLIEEPMLANDTNMQLYAWLRHPRPGVVAERRLEVGDFIVPLLHVPIHERESNGMKRISYIHPEDEGIHAYRIVDASATGKTIPLTGGFSQGGYLAASDCLNSRELLRSLVGPDGAESIVVESLCEELDSSVEHVAYAFAHRAPTPTLDSPAIAWEQSLVEGHPLHPMHKSRLAVSPVALVRPGSRQLDSPILLFVLLPRDGVRVSGEYDTYAELLFPPSVLASIDRAKDVVIPVHPLQLPNVLAHFPSAILVPGTLPAIAQSSLRTLALKDHEGWSVKMPLGIKVTSALRTISKWTPYMSPRIIGLLDKLVSKSDGLVRIIRDVAGISGIHESTESAKHLSCMIRRDAAHILQKGEIAIIGAALPERDAAGVPFVVSAFGLDTHAKRLSFFDRYTELYLHGFLPPAHEFGFAFEAHGQNILAIFDRDSVQLKGFAVRDYGGIRAHQDTLQRTLGEKLDILPGSCNPTDKLEKVYGRLYHAAVQCHMQELIRALDLHYSGEGWEIVRRHLKNTVPMDSGLYRFFTTPRVEIKCFIRMKMDGLYRDVRNFILGPEFRNITTEAMFDLAARRNTKDMI